MEVSCLEKNNRRNILTLKEIIVKLKRAVGIGDWDLVMEMIEELEILLHKEEFGNDMINTWDE